MKLDIVLELWKRRHRSPYSVAVADLETYSDSYDDGAFRALVDEIVRECDAIGYADRNDTEIQLTERGKPQSYIDELNEQNEWYQ